MTSPFNQNFENKTKTFFELSLHDFQAILASLTQHLLF